MKAVYRFSFLILIICVFSVTQIHSTHLLFTWGYNGSGQLGDGTTYNRSSPILISTDSNWVNIFSCFETLFAIKSDGTLWGCGLNNGGQIGDGTTTDRHSLVQIGNDTNWSFISNSNLFTLGLKTNGTLWSWGYNSHGNLGDSSVATRISPVRVGRDSNWAFIKAGDDLYSLAIKTDGSLWGWGYNSRGALDSSFNAATSTNPIPFRIDGWTSWQIITSNSAPNDGGDNTIALTVDGYLWGWGSNNQGELSHNHLYGYSTAQPIDTTMTWIDVSEGYGYTLAIRSDSSLWACGYNQNHQLGDGTTFERDSLVRLGNETNWVKLFTSSQGTRSFAIKSNGSIWGWGNTIYTPVQFTNLTRVVEFSYNDNFAAIIDVLPPTLTMDSITNIDQYSASLNYHINTLSTPPYLTYTNAIARGICWDTAANPTINNNHTSYSWTIIVNFLFSDDITELLPVTTYHVRAYTTTPAGTGYSQDTTFTTKSYQLIPLQQGWNMVSTYINPDTTDFWVLCQPVSQHVVVGKNSAGQFYVPSLGINYIFSWQYNQAYQFYMSSADTLRIDGPKFVPDSTPIYLSPGWGMISYLRNSPMAIDSALSSISSSFLIVKNGTGQFYIPSMYINTIGNMLPGQGYQIYMLENGVLYYPRNW